MQYMGSKRRLVKYIKPFIDKYRGSGQIYVEPFVGGCNMIEHIDGERIGADLNPYVIAYFQKAQEGWLPPEDLSYEEYYQIKKNMDKYPKELVAHAMISCSFGARFGEGYARNKTQRNYSKEGRNNLIRQIPKLMNVKFVHSSYLDLEIPDSSLIYCDPPYRNTKQYLEKGFNHELFFDWCRKMSEKGHTIFISEIEAPSDFKMLFEIEQKTNVNNNTKKERVVRFDRLFTI